MCLWFSHNLSNLVMKIKVLVLTHKERISVLPVEWFKSCNVLENLSDSDTKITQSYLAYITSFIRMIKIANRWQNVNQEVQEVGVALQEGIEIISGMRNVVLADNRNWYGANRANIRHPFICGIQKTHAASPTLEI